MESQKIFFANKNQTTACFPLLARSFHTVHNTAPPAGPAYSMPSKPSVGIKRDRPKDGANAVHAVSNKHRKQEKPIANDEATSDGKNPAEEEIAPTAKKPTAKEDEAISAVKKPTIKEEEVMPDCKKPTAKEEEAISDVKKPTSNAPEAAAEGKNPATKSEATVRPCVVFLTFILTCSIADFGQVYLEKVARMNAMPMETKIGNVNKLMQSGQVGVFNFMDMALGHAKPIKF